MLCNGLLSLCGSRRGTAAKDALVASFDGRRQPMLNERLLTSMAQTRTVLVSISRSPSSPPSQERAAVEAGDHELASDW